MIKRIVVILLLLTSPALAQQETFSTYMNSLPVATVPLAGTELILVAQGGLAHRTPVTSIPASTAALAVTSLSFTASSAVLQAGPATSVTGVSQAIDWTWGASAATSDMILEGGLWPTGKVFTGLGLASIFTSADNSSGTDLAPNNTVFVYAQNNGSNSDINAVLGDSNCAVSATTCFGANFIVRSNGGSLTNVKLVGMEIDWEPAAGDTTVNSGVLFLNAFSSTVPNGIQFGAISGGGYTNLISYPGVFAVDGTGQVFASTQVRATTALSGFPRLELIDSTQGGWDLFSDSSGLFHVATADASGNFVADALVFSRTFDATFKHAVFIPVHGLVVGSGPADEGAGTINFLTAIYANGSIGLTQTCTVNQAKTLIFTLGILTGGSCNT